MFTVSLPENHCSQKASENVLTHLMTYWRLAKASNHKKAPSKGTTRCNKIPKIWLIIYISEVKGERRACPGAPDNARTNLVEQLIKDVTGRPDVCNLFLYGCWCGPRGRGKYLDNFD